MVFPTMHTLVSKLSLVFAVTLLTGCATEPPAEVVTRAPRREAKSQLWGGEGELWLQAGRLPDFSYAGYRNGEKPIPDYPVTANVETFGARGDDEKDDTQAFKAALAATKTGAVFVPAGRYIITDNLKIARSGVVLRGAGTGRTTLFFPKPLQAIKPDTGATTSGVATSNYSWSGGFVQLAGGFGSKVLTRVQGKAARGDQVIRVEKPQALTVGQMIEVRLTDTKDDSLAKHLYSGDAGDTSKLGGTTRTSFVTKITAIRDDRVHLERRLRFDVRPEWQPEVRSFEPTVTDSGVEDIAFAFPVTPYRGHFTEQGFNPLTFDGVAHCWGRRLKFVNPDSGPMVGGVFNTVSDVSFHSERKPDRDGNQGHHGIYLRRMGDHLFTRFDFKMRFVHDISVSGCAGVVVSKGAGVDLCFDNHKRAPYETLYTEIDVGAGTRPWRSGGGAALGKHAGARITFWNIRAVGPLPEPPSVYAPWSMNLIGVDMGRPGTMDPKGLWREFTAGETVGPVNLYEAQLKRRLAAPGGSR